MAFQQLSAAEMTQLTDCITRLAALVQSKDVPVSVPSDAHIQPVLGAAATRGNLNLLRSGVIPNDRERHDIATDLDAMARLRESIQSEIVLHSLKLAQTVHQQAQVMMQEARSAAMLSPVRLLPPEILSVIFEYALPERWTDECMGGPGLNYAAVCSTWRAVALSTPQLWRYINVHFLFYATRWKEAMEAHLARSGNLPLSVSLTFNPVRNVTTSFEEAWSLLYSHSHRWGSLTVDELPMPARYTQLPWPDHFPTLTQLHLQISSPYRPAKLFALASAPITSLQLDLAQPLRPVPSQLPSSWRITRLAIFCYSARSSDLAQYLPMISSCSASLRYLDVGEKQCSYSPTTHGLRSTTLPHLEHLKASNYGARLCQVFSMPNLKSAALRGRASSAREDEPRCLSYFADALSSSSFGKHLESLTLTNLAGVWRILEECLDLLPTLSHLVIEDIRNIRYTQDSFISRSLIYILVRDTDDSRSMARLPNLTHLTMTFGGTAKSGPGRSKVSLVKEVVASRSQACMYEGEKLAALKRFETDLPGDWTLPVSQNVVT
ncbi:uncharacterized protein SCHCODRAFT_02533015 [Schizophyllum commune H4-8]|nr:uncharacterized protein SCHCODRAFT_02533015 [Schizophyllum commune H4-8]KAI5896708.1 hypothetical protein SCHCODRAFT_02533015 [Schizophyllum commune H4-8]